jgi:pseudouridine synthase, RluA family
MQSQTTIALEAIIQPEFAGCRLDQALAQLFPDYSRERLKTWVLAGQCHVDGTVLRPKDKVLGGEQVIINATVEVAVAWAAEDLPLDIIYEDEDLLVINKSANVVVHPGAGNRAGTLVNALLNHAPELNQVPRAGIVHRLDKDTTGLLVVARNLTAHTSLVSQLQARTVTRIYEAVVHGLFLAGSTISEPIGRHPRDRKKMAVVGDGKPAVTHYRVLQKFAKHTHIQVQLETGRTHQIRVHMAHVRHPIVGDQAYAPRIQHKFPRQALHAKSLSFIHPRTGLEIGWETTIPTDMQNLIKELSGCNNNI